MKHAKTNSFKAASLSMLLAAPLAGTVQAQDFEFEDFNDALILEEIIVTARKRQESLQDTPVAVSAFSSDALRAQGIANIEDLELAVPGLTIAANGQKAPALFIRGVGQRETIATLDPGVGVYINNIYVARTDSQLLDTVDIESIEVLRGPQGTLFGKNNTGGAILVNTKEPHTGSFEGEASMRLGNFGRKDGRIGANIPLSDSVGMRVGLKATRFDGFMENPNDGQTYGDEDRLSFSSRILWEAGDVFSTDIFAYYSKQMEKGVGYSCIPNAQGQTSPVNTTSRADVADSSYRNTVPVDLDNSALLRECQDAYTAGQDYKTLINGESKYEIESSILSATLSWDFDDFSIKSISSWSHTGDVFIEEDQDGTAASFLGYGTGSTISNIELHNAAAAAGVFNVNPNFNPMATPGFGNLPIDLASPLQPINSNLQEKRDQWTQELQVTGYAFDERLTYTFGAFASVEQITDNASSTASSLGKDGWLGYRDLELYDLAVRPIVDAVNALGSTSLDPRNPIDAAAIIATAQGIAGNPATPADVAAQIGGTLQLLDGVSQQLALGFPGFSTANLVNGMALSPGDAGYIGTAGIIGKSISGYSDVDNRTYGIFAQGEFDVTDSFKVTLGARYTQEERERNLVSVSEDLNTAYWNAISGNSALAGLGLDPAVQGANNWIGIYNPLLSESTINYFYFGANPVDYMLANPPSVMPMQLSESSDSETWTKFTPMINFSYAFGEDFFDSLPIDKALTYLTYSVGFKAGGFEVKGDTLNSFEPEEVANLEFGLKTDWFDRRIRANLALYHMQYSDMQVRIAQQAGLAEPEIFFANAGESTIQGMELEVTAKVTEALVVAGSMSYTDAKYDKFFDGTNDRSNEDMPSVPPLSLSLSASYDWNTEVGAIIPFVSVNFQDEMYVGIDGDAWTYNKETATFDAYTLVNARLTFVPAGMEEFEATLWMNNVTDEFYYQGGYATTSNLAGTVAVVGAPRTYGVELSYFF